MAMQRRKTLFDSILDSKEYMSPSAHAQWCWRRLRSCCGRGRCHQSRRPQPDSAASATCSRAPAAAAAVCAAATAASAHPKAAALLCCCRASESATAVLSCCSAAGLTLGLGWSQNPSGPGRLFLLPAPRTAGHGCPCCGGFQLPPSRMGCHVGARRCGHRCGPRPSGARGCGCCRQCACVCRNLLGCHLVFVPHLVLLVQWSQLAPPLRLHAAA